jgi:hypothetical protein
VSARTLIAGAMLALTLIPAAADTQYRFSQKLSGLKGPTCVNLDNASDGLRELCGMGSEELYPVVDGKAFLVEEVDPFYGFNCPSGSKYATDAQALAIAQMTGNPVYTPLNSAKPTTCASEHCGPSYAKGIARAREADGGTLYFNMYSSYSQGQATRHLPKLGNAIELVPAESLQYRGWSYMPASPKVDNSGVYRACTFTPPAA